MSTSAPPTPEAAARERAKYLTGLVWHTGAFVIINACWILDIALGASGAGAAFRITAFWGIALAFHALAYYADGRQLERRKTREYLEQHHGDIDDDHDHPGARRAPTATI